MCEERGKGRERERERERGREKEILFSKANEIDSSYH